MKQRALIIDYELVRGLPSVVEKRVQDLIARAEGWQPKGKPTPIKDNGCDILVQCMVKLND